MPRVCTDSRCVHVVALEAGSHDENNESTAETWRGLTYRGRGEIHALIALVAVTLAYWRKIRLEEQVLGKTFGAEFDAYRRDTGALVPLLY